MTTTLSPSLREDASRLNSSASPTGAAAFTPDRALSPLPRGWSSLSEALIQSARRGWGETAMVDSTRTEATYGDVLIRSLALGLALKRALGDSPYEGLLLPPTVPAAIANYALTLLGKIPVNLNYSASDEIINSSIRQCSIRHVITSKRALERLKVKPDAELVLLEDLAPQVTKFDKIQAFAMAKFAPILALKSVLPGLRAELDDPATIIFTSGSTGDPKGVMLSHRNILSNIHQVNNHLRLAAHDVVLGILPLFHSMGYTVTLWMTACLRKKAIYHFNPLDARIVGELCRTHRVTLMVSTPTFMRTYLHKCQPEQFESVTHLVLGAEKLKPELAREIRDKLKIEPLEGYGCTELSPVVAVNLPYDAELDDGRQVPGNLPGSVGLPVPGTAIRTVDPESGRILARGEEGLVQVHGPQVMTGYLNRPEETAKVLTDGWYNTGDLGFHGEDGYLRITDRLSRFSKIGGEMVPHLRVESAIMEAAGVDEQQVAVTSVPDLRRGERLIVLHTAWGCSIADVVGKLQRGSMPKLWIPSADDFVRIETIPVLGSGKVDLKKVKTLAAESVAAKDA